MLATYIYALKTAFLKGIVFKKVVEMTSLETF